MGSAYWGGLLDWMRERMLGDGKITAGDLERIVVTDDLGAVVDICQAADHRRPRASLGLTLGAQRGECLAASGPAVARRVALG